MSVLDTLNFQPMLITDVFDSVTASKAWYDKNKIQSGSGAYSYVSRSRMTNGHESVVSRQDLPPNTGNAITIGVDTQSVFYQPASFYTSVKIQVLRHPRMTAANALVLVTLLKEQMMKFQWGNGVSLDRLRVTHIMVPTITNAAGIVEADWEGMERLGSELLEVVITHTRRARQTQLTNDDTLPELSFKPMLITDVFETYRQAPAWLNANQVTSGTPRHPHVSNTARSNSISSFIAHQEQAPNRGNAITVGIDTQVVAFQPVPFYGATKVFELRSSRLNANSALVLMAALRQAIAKFSWGHKASARRLEATRIMVPVVTNAEGEDVIDWDGMSAYGHALRVRVERRTEEALRALSQTMMSPQ